MSEKHIQTRIQLNIGLARKDPEGNLVFFHTNGFHLCPVIAQLQDTLRELNACFFGFTCNALRIERVESLCDGKANIEHTLAVEFATDNPLAVHSAIPELKGNLFELSRQLGQDCIAFRLRTVNVANGETLRTHEALVGPRDDRWNDGKFDPACFIDPREDAAKVRGLLGQYRDALDIKHDEEFERASRSS